jgi:hypothetical protein
VADEQPRYIGPYEDPRHRPQRSPSDPAPPWESPRRHADQRRQQSRPDDPQRQPAQPYPASPDDRRTQQYPGGAPDRRTQQYPGGTPDRRTQQYPGGAPDRRNQQYPGGVHGRRARPPRKRHRRELILLPIGALLLVLVTVVLLASRGSATTTPPVHTAPPQPDTAEGAQAAAQQVFRLYTAGKYSTVYPAVVPSVRAAVAEATWVTVHQRCTIPLVPTPYTIGTPFLTDQTAVVILSSGATSQTQVFDYLGGTWLWAPSGQDLAAYHGSVTKIVGQLKSDGFSCK